MISRRLTFAALGALALTLGGCGRILGIHDSHLRDGGAEALGAGGAGGAPASDGGAGTGVPTAGNGGGAGTSVPTAGNGGAGAGGSAGGAAGTGTAGAAAGSGVDAHPPDDAKVDASDGGSLDVATEAPPRCKDYGTTSVQALELGSGPNSNNPGINACEFPNEILARTTTVAPHYYAAASSEMFVPGVCGACLLLETPDGSKSVEVQIIDTTTTQGKMAIDPAAQQLLGGNNPTVNARFVPCHYGGNIEAAFRGQFDAALILYNVTTRPTAVEISSNGATWTPLSLPKAGQGNHWLPPGGFTPGTSERLRLTDDSGSTIETTMSFDLDGAYRDTGVQFAPCTP